MYKMQHFQVTRFTHRNMHSDNGDLYPHISDTIKSITLLFPFNFLFLLLQHAEEF